MRVSLVDEPPATLAVRSEINSLVLSASSPSVCFCEFVRRDVRLEVGELSRELILGLVPELGGLLRRL